MNVSSSSFYSHHHQYDGAFEWFIKFRNPFGEYGQLRWEPTFLGNEIEYYMLAILTYIHAYRHGGRYMWLWWTTIAHGLTTECVSYWSEPIDNFWHAQSTLMFFGQREPLHIMCLYPGFIYTASVAVARLGISELTEACAVGLFVVIFDMPYDIMGIKLLWWTWHDTDANIRDRHYWVPWTSYYFHMAFASAFNLIYNKSRRYFVGISGLYSNDDIQRMPYAQQRIASNYRGEFKALLVTGLFSMPFGICQFVPGYHLFKDVFNIHASVTTTLLGCIYTLCLFYGLQHGKPVNLKEIGEREEARGDKKAGVGKWYYDECYTAMMMHYVHYMLLVIFANPASIQALGMHQNQGSPIGNTDGYSCDQTRNLTYPYPFTSAAFPWFMKGDIPDVSVWKRPYLCENGDLLDEAYFNFECESAKGQAWVNNNQWYWICGTDWSNQGKDGTTHIEYILVVLGICIIGINLYTMALCYPRNFYEQFFVLGEFPKYYKTGAPSTVITNIDGDRINRQGRREFKVRKVRLTGGFETVWEEHTTLVQDCVGPVYGERGGLFGMLHDTYGGSTRDRLRTYDGYQHALGRLALFDTKHSRKPVAGIVYRNGVPVSGVLEPKVKVARQRKKRSKSPAVRHSDHLIKH